MIREKLPDGSWREIGDSWILWYADSEKIHMYGEHIDINKESKAKGNRLFFIADSKEDLYELAKLLMSIATGEIDQRMELRKEQRKNAENERAEGGLHEDRSPEADQHENRRAQS